MSLGIPLGFYAAKRHGRAFDHAGLVGSLIGISIPIFFLAIILKYIFSVRLGWLPSVGRESVLIDAQHPTGFYVLDGIVTGNWNAAWDATKHLILPAIALGSIPLAIIARITRASALDVQNEDYVRTARAKGMSPGIVDRRHVMRNALLPVVTIVGLQVGLLLGGAILTETVFAIPGMGSWIAQAIFNRDYPVIQGGVLFLAIVFVFVNLIVDISYGFLNPRIRVSVSIAELEGQLVGPTVPTGGLWHEAWRRLRHDRGAIVGFCFVLAFVLAARPRAGGRPVRAARPGPRTDHEGLLSRPVVCALVRGRPAR